jgi:CheY-like chemotaxis protein
MKKYELVCIIDDDPIYIFGTRRIMEIAGYGGRFLVFENGKKAIDGLAAIISSQSKLPEVIFLDLNMPVMDGWDFLDEFRKLPAPVQVDIYILSSSIDPADTTRAKQYAEVRDFLVKPLTSGKLKELMG